MIIFDSSALIAWVKQESGWEVIPRVAAKADVVMMATINYAGTCTSAQCRPGLSQLVE